MKNDHYSYRVIWSEDDNEHVGLCTEFPSLSWLAETPERALHGIQEVVAEVIADMKKNNEPIPAPLSTKKFSGKFSTRIPPDVHRMLALEAAEAGISFNRLVSAKLSRAAAGLFLQIKK
jgi:predicted HicB family RNase H-like nuclease